MKWGERKKIAEKIKRNKKCKLIFHRNISIHFTFSIFYIYFFTIFWINILSAAEMVKCFGEKMHIKENVMLSTVDSMNESNGMWNPCNINKNIFNSLFYERKNAMRNSSMSRMHSPHYEWISNKQTPNWICCKCWSGMWVCDVRWTQTVRHEISKWLFRLVRNCLSHFAYIILLMCHIFYMYVCICSL